MKARYFVALAVLCFGFGVYQLFQSQQAAKSLQDTIVAKDASGYDTAAEQAQLVTYTASHMQTGRTIFLEGSYARAKAAAEKASVSVANGSVYSQAQAACGGGHADSITQAKCVSAYVSSHAQPAANPQPVSLPSQADYTRKFASPVWNPSFGGIALLVGGVLIVFASFLVLR